MSRAGALEQENDQQFNLLANKISAFKNIANDINQLSIEDNNNQLTSLSNQMSQLQSGIKNSALKLNHVMRSNPKITKMVLVSFVIFLIIYYSAKYI